MSWHADNPPLHPCTALHRPAGVRLVPEAACETSVRQSAATAPGSVQTSDLLERRIGLRLRQLRHERRWSLDHLAGKAGVSRAMLGQIELGRSAPTVRVLMRIAGGLDIDVMALLAPARPKPHVLRADTTASATRDPRPVLRRLDSGQPGMTTFHAVQLPPGGTASHPDTVRHCRVNAVVAHGRVEVDTGSETLTLGQDDALEVDTAVPLHWHNTGDGAALVYAVWSCDR